MSLAPIVLFVYNRSWHTEQTLNALMQNELADQSILYIYADGPKDNSTTEQLECIKEVRKVIREKKWCKEIHIIESEKNKGLAKSIIEGVTNVINEYGKVIVLEDDIVTSEQFLDFMNGALDFYERKELIFGVSGFNYPSIFEITSSHFLPIGCSWSWGTWGTRWKSVNFDAEYLEHEIIRNDLQKRLDFGGYPFYKMLKDQISGHIDSWAIRFYTSMFLQGRLFVYPSKSLVTNVGFDETASHTKGSDNFFDSVSRNRVEIEFPEPIIDENSNSVKIAFENRYLPPTLLLKKVSFIGNVCKKIKKILR